ncbi:MAG TPA: HNH endonuclease [Reyranella sp.]|nr:HNH endonuclease [Reyranella sp.]
MSDVGIILSNPRRGEAFRAFLAERGCDVLAPTNKYEALRFKRAGRTNVIYRKANGRYTVVGNDVELAVAAFTSAERRGRRGIKVTMAIPPAVQARRAKLRGSAVHKALIARDGDRCFYCGRRLGDDQSREHLVPAAHGGSDRLDNLALAHHACNVKAGELGLVDKIKLRDRLRSKRR